MTGLTVIICGSRDGAPVGTRWGWFTSALDAFDAKHRIAHVIQGGAKGIDALAHDWSRSRLRPCTTFWADWDRYKRGAGPRRNAAMLEHLCRITEAANRGVLAFPGDDGTEGMVALSLGRSVPVWRCSVAGRSGWEWTAT